MKLQIVHQLKIPCCSSSFSFVALDKRVAELRCSISPCFCPLMICREVGTELKATTKMKFTQYMLK